MTGGSVGRNIEFSLFDKSAWPISVAEKGGSIQLSQLQFINSNQRILWKSQDTIISLMDESYAGRSSLAPNLGHLLNLDCDFMLEYNSIACPAQLQLVFIHFTPQSDGELFITGPLSNSTIPIIDGVCALRVATGSKYQIKAQNWTDLSIDSSRLGPKDAILLEFVDQSISELYYVIVGSHRAGRKDSIRT